MKINRLDILQRIVVHDNFFILTYLQLPVAIPEMHAVAETIAPHLAMGAVACFHPFTVTILFKSVLPDIPEAVLVYVSLMVVAANTQAARDGAVSKDRSDIDSCAA